MSLSWDREIRADRIYLPAGDTYHDGDSNEGVPIDEEIIKYVDREFPLPSNDATDVVHYSIPKTFIQHGEKQAYEAEEISHRRLNDVQFPQTVDGKCISPTPLWQACFQGVCYAGRSYRNTRDGKFVTREHDLVVFNIYRDKYYVSLIEVKSTCDDPSTGFIISDSTSIKNNKRSGQHQLRDHIEILKVVSKIPENSLNCFLFWPFLTMWTRGNKVKRWEKESEQHVFTDTICDQEKFNEWYFKNVLCGKSIGKSDFEKLFKRFIVLSCGIFVNEIHAGMLALLSQQQTSLLYRKPADDGAPTVVHGAAGTGKTLLVLHKLNFLYQRGLLNQNNRALYICYWQGIRMEFKQKLEKLKISEYVDTVIFHITQHGFLKNARSKYRHIFMDECEAICLAFSEEIIKNTFHNIERCRLTDFDKEYYVYHHNCVEEQDQSISPKYAIKNEEIDVNSKLYGDLWYLVDINQATIFIPQYSPTILKQASITLSRVVRNTGAIYRVFSQFYKNPMPLVASTARLSDLYLSNIVVGHNIIGPPIYWVDTNQFSEEPICPGLTTTRTFNGLIKLIVDLYSTKGIKPRDLCVLPFLISDVYLPENINKAISSIFVATGYQPTAITDVEDFVSTSDSNKFLVPWVLRVKGLEFKVVIISIEEEDEFDCMDPEDRRKIYIMASRCTCLLILVTAESVKDTIDVYKVIQAYPFNIEF